MRARWFQFSGMALVLALIAGSAHAAGVLFTPYDWAAAGGKALDEDLSYSALADSPATASLQLVQANTGLLDEKAQSLSLDLEPGLELRAHRVESYVDESGSLVWSGVLEDTPGVPFSVIPHFDPIDSVMMVRNGDKITGNVHFKGGWYQIRPLRSGGHAIVKADSRRMPLDHPREYNRLPVTSMRRSPSAGSKGGGVPLGVSLAIQVMVNYTAAAAARSGDINGLIDLAVAEANQGYKNSGVFISLRLANRSQVSYTESSNIETNLTRYRGTADGYMDNIHATRDSVSADVGVLLLHDVAYCGLASGIGSTAATAFAAVSWQCATGQYSFAHEIGHLLSARHNPAADPTNTPYAYGHGYQYLGSPSWRTIMAYNCPGTGTCPRLNYWSNPNKLYNGQPMGTSTTSDNTRVLNDTRFTVSEFR